ncbi:MAG: DoxX family protein [Candidatus Korobacteraceae bacterium]
MTTRLLPQLQPLGLLALRLALGVTMIAHGWPKMMNIQGFASGLLANIGVPGWMAYLVVAAEVGGGILLILGLLTPFAAAAVAIDMAVAIVKVHFKRGLTGQGGYEFTLILFTVALTLIFFGAGPLSLDHLIFGKGGPRRR